MARWHAKLKNWHAVWHVGMFIGTLARENEKLARVRHVCTWESWHVNHADTLARWHKNHASTQGRWYVDHVGTHARDLANSLMHQQFSLFTE